MNKICFILFLFSFQSLSAQDSIILLNEVTINKFPDRDIRMLMKNIKKSLKKNYQTGPKAYRVKQLSILNSEDTLINNNLIYVFDIKSLDNNYVRTRTLEESNQAYKKPGFFEEYDDSKDSPEYWISEILIRKNLDILDFDVFNNISEYNFDVTTEGNLMTVHFTSEEMYSGFFICNKENYNLHTLSFSNSQPYPFSVSGSDNGKEKSLKTWEYTFEHAVIDFTENSSHKISVKSIMCTEEINDYKFEKYDTKGNVIKKEGSYDFHSSLKMEEVSSD